MNRNIFEDICLVVFSAVLFCYQGFVNHFPLTYDDTGTYMGSGFSNNIPSDRPILYGLFIRHISMKDSLWFVIFAQGLILAYLIFVCVKYLVKGPIKPVAYLTIVLLLTFLTGASVNVSQLIPDFFTPVMLICFALLFIKELKLAEKIVIAVILVFSISTHNSHGTIGLITLSIVTIGSLLRKSLKKIGKPLVMIWLLLFAGMVTIPTVNFLISGHLQSKNANHIFIMYKLNEMGILQDYLNHTCAEKHWKICAYKDSIQTNFIWDAKSPVYKEGGWDSTRVEYNNIIWGIFSSPHYLKLFIENACSNSLEQLFTFDTGDVPPNTPGTSPYGHISWLFPMELKQLELSSQYRNLCNFTLLNQCQFALIILSLFMLCFVFYMRRKNISSIMCLWSFLFISGIIANAIVCGSFSQVMNRYEARVIWLLPLLVFFLLIEQWQQAKNLCGQSEPEL